MLVCIVRMNKLIQITLKIILPSFLLIFSFSVIALFLYSHFFLKSNEVQDLTETLENVYLDATNIERQVFMYKARLPLEKGEGIIALDASFDKELNTISNVTGLELDVLGVDFEGAKELLQSEYDVIVATTCDISQSGHFIQSGGTVTQLYITLPGEDEISSFKISKIECDEVQVDDIEGLQREIDRIKSEI